MTSQEHAENLHLRKRIAELDRARLRGLQGHPAGHLPHAGDAYET